MAQRVPVKKVPEKGFSSPPPTTTTAARRRASLVTPTKTCAVLHPPPDVRCIVDKTAEFVALNGLEFEQKILSNEKRNPRFNFLKSKDAYHVYYQRRIIDFIDQQQQAPDDTAKQAVKQAVKQASDSTNSLQ